MEDWMVSHKKLITEFLSYLFANSQDFVLKGGTSLMLCYGLDRFSEDIDFDGFGRGKETFFILVDRFVTMSNGSMSYRIGKDTDMVKRVFIHYKGSKPLKVEVSFRRARVMQDEVSVINGMLVYTIPMLFMMKINSFSGRDKIRDLYDIVFMYHNYKNYLNGTLLSSLSDVVAFKGVEYVDFLLKNQGDKLVNADLLAEKFMYMYYDLGLR